MQYDEQQLINGLFQRLKQAEQQNGQRDAQAERQIAELVRQQPAAPYYMAQSMLIQEAALKRMQARVQELENQLAQQQSQHSSGGGSFLSGLFGGNKNQPVQPAQNWGAPPVQQQPQQYASQAPTTSRGSGFMAGALQTAAGVAGGVVIADMLTSMFHHSQPQEIVNIIEEPAAAASDATQNDAFNSNAFNNASDTHFLDNSDPYQADSAGDYQNDDFGSDDFSNDDDSFI